MSYPDPRYTGDTGEVSAALRRADHDPDLVTPTTRVHYLSTGATTHGLFGLYRYDMGASPSGPGPHFHRTLTESFFVLSGTVRLHDGTGWVDATAGDHLYVPEGGIHGFRNESGALASMLILFAPGAPREAYFEQVRHMADAGEADRAAFFRDHDTTWV